MWLLLTQQCHSFYISSERIHLFHERAQPPLGTVYLPAIGEVECILAGYITEHEPKRIVKTAWDWIRARFGAYGGSMFSGSLCPDKPKRGNGSGPELNSFQFHQRTRMNLCRSPSDKVRQLIRNTYTTYITFCCQRQTFSFVLCQGSLYAHGILGLILGHTATRKGRQDENGTSGQVRDWA